MEPVLPSLWQPLILKFIIGKVFAAVISLWDFFHAIEHIILQDPFILVKDILLFIVGND